MNNGLVVSNCTGANFGIKSSERYWGLDEAGICYDFKGIPESNWNQELTVRLNS